MARMLVIFVVVIHVGWCTADVFPNVSKYHFTGSVAMFAVPRRKVQDKLDEIHSKIPCTKERLTLPEPPVLQDLIGPEEHVVTISVGVLEASSFLQTLPKDVAEDYALRTPTVEFELPYLSSSDPRSPPKYRLELGSFVSSEKPFIQPHGSMHSMQVEDILLSDAGVFLKDGEHHLNISWSERVCKPKEYLHEEDLDQQFHEMTVPFEYHWDVPFCDLDRSGFQDQEELSSSLSKNRCNVCEIWEGSAPLTECKFASYRLESLSSKYEDIGMLSMDAPFAVESDVVHLGRYIYQGIVMPCLD